MTTRKDSYDNWTPVEAERLRAIADGKCPHPATEDVYMMAAPEPVTVCTSCGNQLPTQPLPGW